MIRPRAIQTQSLFYRYAYVVCVLEETTLAFIFQPTLSQMWPEREAGPPFAFKISMLHVFCSSHGLTHFAALFIDPRAK